MHNTQSCCFDPQVRALLDTAVQLEHPPATNGDPLAASKLSAGSMARAAEFLRPIDARLSSLQSTIGSSPNMCKVQASSPACDAECKRLEL